MDTELNLHKKCFQINFKHLLCRLALYPYMPPTNGKPIHGKEEQAKRPPFYRRGSIPLRIELNSSLSRELTWKL